MRLNWYTCSRPNHQVQWRPQGDGDLQGGTDASVAC